MRALHKGFLSLRQFPKPLFITPCTVNTYIAVIVAFHVMQKRNWDKFRLGRRGRRGRSRRDNKWTEPFTKRWSSGIVNTSDMSNSAPSHGSSSRTHAATWDVFERFPVTMTGRNNSRGGKECVGRTGRCETSHEAPAGPEIDDVVDPEDPTMETVTEEEFHVVEDVSLVLNADDETLEMAEGSIGDTTEPSAGLRLNTLREWRKLSRWQNIFSFLLLNCTGSLSVEQYNHMQVVINTLLSMCYPGGRGLPVSATVKRSVQPLLQKRGFAHSELRTAKSDVRKGGPRCSCSRENPESEGTGCFLVVMPSAWSHMDVAFKSTWEILKHAASLYRSPVLRPVFSTIETVPMVCDKDKILDVAHCIVPTRLMDNAEKSPLLLTERCRQPLVTLHLPNASRLPRPVMLSMGGTRNDERCEVVMQCIALKSVLVCTADNDTGSSVRYERCRRCDLLSGRLKALEVPILDIWTAGDVCTILKGSSDTGHILVLVQQHLRRLGVPQVMELICLPFEYIGNDEELCVVKFDMATREIVSDICVAGTESVLNGRGTPPPTQSFGRLKDGRLFFVDHILLYSDGFSQYNFKQGSAGGVYALSLNYPPALRRTRERVRVLALTPPGISTMQGLRSVIDDIVTSSTVGTCVRNADGEDMVLFTNVVGYVADYHETSYALDITGQNGKAPCHLCAFLRYNGHPSTASQYAYSTMIHSSDTCYARMGTRTEAVRAASLSDEEFVDIGLNRPEQAEKKDSPLRELSRKLSVAMRTTEIPLTTYNRPVVNPSFDPYRSVLVSPDHVLFGVAVNALNFAFAVLPSRTRREQVDELFCTALHRNGLTTEPAVFNATNSRVHTASISTRFFTLLVAPEIFGEVFLNFEECRESSFNRNSPVASSIDNLRKLRDLVTATYWLPENALDGTAAVLSFNENGGRKHLAKLERMCEEYINHLNTACKSFPEARTELDKPNVHRVLELYKHSIPAMGHVRHFFELLFETAHKPLKRAMLRSNLRDSHLQSSLTCLADDWKRRLEYIVDSASQDDDIVQADREGELLKLLLGTSPDVVEIITSNPLMRAEATAILESHPLKTLLKSNPSRLNKTKSFYKWSPSKPMTIDDEDMSSWGIAMREVRTTVRKIAYDFLLNEGNKDVILYESASRVNVIIAHGKLFASSKKAHNTLHRGTALQAWIHDEHAPCLLTSDGDLFHEANMALLAVEGLLSFERIVSPDSRSSPKPYAAVRRCRQTKNDLLHVESNAPLQLLELNDAVRRVGLVHACQRDRRLKCFSSSGSFDECHSAILQGHHFYYYSRGRGYPPRMA